MQLVSCNVASSDHTFTPTKHAVSEHREGQQWMSASTRTVSALRSIVVLSSLQMQRARRTLARLYGRRKAAVF